MYRISIIIPVFNCLSVSKAIDSIPDSDSIQIIVIDGESNKETLELIKKRSDKIDIFVSEKDNGLYDAMNKGIKLADGEWILTLAADDILICDPIKILDHYENEKADLLCGILVAKDFQNRVFLLESNNDMRILEIECSLRHPGSFFHRNVYEKYGLYDIRYRCAADHEMFLRLAKKGAKIKTIPELITLFNYGGISTRAPIKSFKEDMIISDQYRVSKIRSRGSFIFRTFATKVGSILDVLKLPRRIKFLTKEELLKLTEKQPEAISKCLSEINESIA